MKSNNQLVVLATAYKNGDDSVYENLFNSSFKYALSIARKTMEYAFDMEAEDIAFDATYTCINKIITMEDIKGYKSYLATAVQNRCTSFFRTNHYKLVQSTEQTVKNDEDEDWTMLIDNMEYSNVRFNPQEDLNNGETNQIIKGVLEELSKEQRAVFEYYFVEDYSIKEVAEILGEKESTIKGRIIQARSKCRTKLKRDSKRYGLKLPVQLGLEDDVLHKEA